MAADANGDTTMVVEDSEPEREREQQRQQRRLKGRPPVHWPAPSIQDTAAASNSDIEIIAGPSTAVVKPVKDKTSKKKKRRSNDNVGGFKSAAAILKEDARKQSRALLASAKQERKPSIDIESAHNSPVSSVSGSRGVSVHVLEDDDDEVFQLPPPLSTTLRDDEDGVDEVSILPQDLSIACDSPASLFRNNISKFRANASTSASSSSSLFAPRARPSFNKSTSLSALSDSSSASSSSRATSSKLARAKSASASTSSAQTLSIPTPYLAMITSCPVCQASWTVSKTTSSKSSHISKCATSRAYAPRTVIELVERTVKEMKENVDDERRKMVAEKTLFEDLVSRKGKQVLVVGVEQKNKNAKNAKGRNGSDIENNNPSIDLENDEVDVKGKGKARESTAVLFTQGGSAHSQATSTQVQRELNGKIRVAQKLAKGAYIPTNPVKGKEEDGGNMSSSLVGVSMKNLAKDQKSASNGVGSKNWNKAIALLAKSEDSKTSTSSSSTSKDVKSAGESDTSIQDMALDIPPKKRTGKLRSYSETRFRLAEKAAKIADARTVSIIPDGSDSERAHSAVALSNGIKASDSDSNNSIISSTSTSSRPKLNAFPRPFRRTDRPSRSLIDQATMLAKDLDYDLWSFAGSEADIVKDRVVDASSSSIPFPLDIQPTSTVSTEPNLATTTPSSMSAPHPSSPLDDSFSWNDNAPSNRAGSHEYSSSGPFEISALPPPLQLRPSTLDPASSPPLPHHFLSPPAQHSSPLPLSPPPTLLPQVHPTQSQPFVSQTSQASQALLDLTSRMKSTKISTALSRAREERVLLHHHHQQSAREFSTSASASAPREKTIEGKADDEDQAEEESDMQDTQRGWSGNESESNDIDASAIKTKLPKPRKVNYASMLRDAVSAVNKEERREKHSAGTAAAIAEKEKRKAMRASQNTKGEDELVGSGSESDRGFGDGEEGDNVQTQKRGRPTGSKTKEKNEDAAIMLSDSDSAKEAPATTVASPSKRKAKDRSTPPASLSDEASTDDEIMKALAEIDGKARKKSRKKQAGDSPGKTAATSAARPSKQSTLPSTIKTTKKKAASAKVTASDDPPSKAAKGKGTAKAIEKPVPVIDKSKFSLPDYDSWSKEALQAETKKYGYKPSGAKPVLVGQLVRVWRAINPDEAEKMDKAQAAFDRRQQKKLDKASGVSSDEESDEGEPKKGQKEKKEPALAPWKPRPKPKPVSPARSRKSSMSSSGSSDERPLKEVAAAAKASSKAKAKPAVSIKPRKKTAAAASTSSPLKRRRPSRSGSLSSSIRTASDQEETLLSESEAEETKTAGERLRAEVLKDQVLYLRLLRYEPICFTVFESMASQAGIKISKVALRDWLDSQAIIFYYPQEVSRNAKRNGAARKRHP